MRVWKVLGVAGLAGVAASGVAVARAERRRRAYEPGDVRARLHERHQEAVAHEVDHQPSQPVDADREGPEGCLRAVLGRVRPRRRRR